MSMDTFLDIASAYAEYSEVSKNLPTSRYQPHDKGQIQFHRSRHTVRVMVPGNGWGKTRAMGSEASWWIDHIHPYQPTPTHPVQILWFTQHYGQYDVLRAQLESECLTRGWAWNDQKHRYTWPSGDTLHVFSCETSWTHFQGINPDLVLFDEQPPLSLWREMAQRRRGARDTRFVFAATATEGESWMETEFYQPWLAAHVAAGIGMDRAQESQIHPSYWMWVSGGIADNPGSTDEQRRWYAERTWSSEDERRVRLHGGFQSLNASPVFDPQSLLWMADEADRLNTQIGRGREISLVVTQ